MAQTKLMTQYRLRRLAIQLREFTVGDLEDAADVTPEAIHNFLYELKKVDARFISKEPVGTDGPGRPPLLYKLSPEAVEHLANQNLEIARELNQSESGRPAVPAVATVDVHGDLWTPVPWLPEPDVVFYALEPEWNALHDLRGSVLWMKAGQPSSIRTGAEVKIVSESVHTKEEVWRIAGKILTGWQKDLLRSKGSVKCAYDLPRLGRCGLNFHSVSGSLQIELRPLPHKIPTVEELHLPPAVSEFSKAPSGLILAVGIGGSGRSRVLAALLDRINETRKGVVATIEEPMTYVFQKKQCFFEQRQVGIDTPDYWTALTDSLEERVDVLLMGSVEDPNTFATALAAADRSLILCRVTAPNSVAAIEKLIEMAGSMERENVRQRLAANLVGTIGLTVIPRQGGSGFVRAVEVLRVNDAARELIRDSVKIHSLPDYLQMHDPGSQTFQMAIDKLCRDRLINEDWVAQRFAYAK